MHQALHHLAVLTTSQGLFDVTEAVCAWVKEQGISTGLLTVWCRHTSASLLVQANADPEVQADMEAFFVRLAPKLQQRTVLITGGDERHRPGAGAATARARQHGNRDRPRPGQVGHGRACGISAIETFAAGLEAGGAAVRAALTEPWSSGQAGGQVNRLNLLKRQSYGRAGSDLLRRRVLLAPWSTRSAGKPLPRTLSFPIPTSPPWNPIRATIS